MACRFRAMNTDITIQVTGPGAQAEHLIDQARRLFARVELACTRFDPDSALMQANRAGESWVEVPSECYLAIAEAEGAHVETQGLFDPRVLETLVGLGYDRTLAFGDGPVRLSSGTRPEGIPLILPSPAAAAASSRRPPWTPGLDRVRRAVRVGPLPVDLGGIGKGLAVRWASHLLVEAGAGHLVEAGGDCALAGPSPDGGPWRIGVEDPFGGDQPVAVLALHDTAVATSSLRKRTWQLDGRQVHHLIDPRSGACVDGGLRSVTVLDTDAARAEVWSKALLVAGRRHIAELATEKALPALWVDDSGRLAATPELHETIIWSCRDVH